MTVLGQDTFNRADATGGGIAQWNTASDGQSWATAQVSGSPSFAIASKEGTITGATGVNTQYLGTKTSADQELVVRVAVTGATDGIFVVLRGTATNTNYRFKVSGSTMTVNKVVTGTATQLKSVTITTIAANTFYWIRCRVQGSSLFGKVWQDGTAEPATWNIGALSDVTDTAITAAGQFGIGCQLAATTDTIKFDSLYVVDYPVIDALSADDSATTATDTPLATEALSATENALFTDGALPTTALSAGDTPLLTGSFLPTEALSAADSALYTRTEIPTDALSGTESALLTDVFVPTDALSADDSASSMVQNPVGGGPVTTTYSFSEALAASDTPLFTRLTLPSTPLSASDSTSLLIDGFISSEALSTSEAFVQQGALAATDALAASETPLFTDGALSTEGLPPDDSASFDTGAFNASDALAVTENLLTSDAYAPQIESAVASDTFTRGNQSGWGLASDGVDTWAAAQTTGTPTYAISGNEGTITGATGVNTQYLGTVTAADQDVLVRASLSGITDNIFVLLRGTATNTNYRFKIVSGSMAVNKVISGASTQLTSKSILTMTTSTFYWIRCSVIGSSLYGKIWQDGTTEPGWSIAGFSDSSITGPGQAGLGCNLGATGDTVSFDSFTFQTPAQPDALAVSDIGTMQAWNVDALSASESILFTTTELAPEALTVSESPLSTDSYSTSDALSTSDTLAVSKVFLPSNALSVSETFVETGIDTNQFTGGDALIATESLLVTKSSSFSDALTASETFIQQSTLVPQEALTIAETPLVTDAYSVGEALAADDSASTMVSAPTSITTTYNFVEALATVDISGMAQLSTNVIAQDTFVRYDQAGWGIASDGEPWYPLTSGALSIASNEGVVGNTSANTMLLGGQTANLDVQGVVRLSIGAGANDRAGMLLRSSRDGSINYAARYSGNVLGIYLNNAGTALASVAFTPTDGAYHWIRFQITNYPTPFLQAKMWVDGGAEPDWMLATSDYSAQAIQSGGGFGLSATPSASGSVKFDNFTITLPVTALSLYGSTVAATTLPGAGQVATTTGGTAAQDSTVCGIQSGWGELAARSSATNAFGSGAIGTPSGNGFLLDAESMENKQFVAGAWSGKIPLKLINDTNSLTASVTMRVYAYNVASQLYRHIVDMTSSSASVNSTGFTAFTCSGSTSSTTTLGNGDKLYYDVWANILSSSVTSPSAALAYNVSNSSASGVASDAEIDTPGYLSAVTTTNALFTELLTGTDSASNAALGALWSESLAASDIGTMQAWNVDALSVSDALVAAANEVAPEGLAASESLFTASLSVPLEALTVDDSASSMAQQTIAGPTTTTYNFSEGLAASESLFTVTSFAVVQLNTLGADNFNRATNATGGIGQWNPASDGENWAQAQVTNTPQFVISANEGVATGATGVNTLYLGARVAADIQLLVRFSVSGASDSLFVVLRGITNTTCYRVKASGSTLTINRVVNGTATPLATTTIAPLAPGAYYWLRCQAFGNQLSANVWADGTTEPTSWPLFGVIDSAPLGAGQYGLGFNLTSSTDTINFDTFLATTPADSLSIADVPGGSLISWGIDALTVDDSASSMVQQVVGVPTTLAYDLPGTRTASGGWGLASDGVNTWASAGGTFTWAVSGGECTATGATVSGYQVLGSNATNDLEVMARFTVVSATDSIGMVFRYSGTNNHYRWRCDGATLAFLKVVGGVTTTLASLPMTMNAGGAYWFRYRMVGGNFSGKMWADGTNEPTVWSLTATDATFASGKFGIYVKPSSATNTLKMDTFSMLVPPASGFVYRPQLSTTLLLAGQPFFAVGANLYWLASMPDTGNGPPRLPTPYEVDDGLKSVVEMGGTTVRAFSLGMAEDVSGATPEQNILPVGPPPTPPDTTGYLDQNFQQRDWAIYRAGLLGLKLIIPLVNNGDRGFWTSARGISDITQFYYNAQVITDYQNYCQHLITHVNPYTGLAWKDDPTILWWETGNELQPPSDSTFTSQMSDFFKSIDPNHLVLDGSNGVNSFELGWSPDTYSDHLYPLFTSQVSSDVALTAGANKTLILGEYDWRPGVTTAQGTWNLDNTTYKSASYSFHASVTTPGSTPSDFKIQQGSLNLVNNETYTLSFYYRCPNGGSITTVVQSGVYPYVTYQKKNLTLSATTTFLSKSVASFTMTNANTGGLLLIEFGSFAGGDLWIDDVKLTAQSSGNNILTNGNFDTGSLSPWTEYLNTNTISTLPQFYSLIESTPTVNGDLFWSLFPHNDYQGYGWCLHGDPYTLYYPGYITPGMTTTQTDVTYQAQAALIRKHGYTMRGLPVPPAAIPDRPLITSVQSNTPSTGQTTIAWRGVMGAVTYQLDQLVGNTWVTLGTTYTDFQTPVQVTSSASIFRVRGLGIDAVTPPPYGPYGYYPYAMTPMVENLPVSDAMSTTMNVAFLEPLAVAESGTMQALNVQSLSVTERLLTTGVLSVTDALTVSDSGALRSWNVDALSASDTLFTTTGQIANEPLTVIETLLESGGAFFAETLSASDACLVSTGMTASESLSANESMSVFTSSSASETLSAGDVLVQQSSTSATELLALIETSLATDTSISSESLNASDSASSMLQITLGSTSSYSFSDLLSASDASVFANGPTSTDALVASSAALYMLLAVPTEALAASSALGETGIVAGQMSGGDALPTTDAILCSRSIVPTDALAIAESMNSASVYAVLEPLVIAETGVASDAFIASEMQSVAESLLGGRAYVPVEALSGIDSLLETSLTTPYAFTEMLAASDAASVGVDSFLPMEALAASDTASTLTLVRVTVSNALVYIRSGSATVTLRGGSASANVRAGSINTTVRY